MIKDPATSLIVQVRAQGGPDLSEPQQCDDPPDGSPPTAMCPDRGCREPVERLDLLDHSRRAAIEGATGIDLDRREQINPMNKEKEI